jgi:hypothetical protein
MSRFLKQGKIPTWRLGLWAIVAMVGVGYFIPDNSPRLFWVSVFFTGAFVVGMAHMLYWVQTSQWLRANAIWLVVIGTLLTVLLELLDILYSR